jgi:hypothetical protein
LLGIILSFLVYREYFKVSKILPFSDPWGEERFIVRFHQLKAYVSFFVNPRMKVIQTFWQHPSVRVKPIINLFKATWLKPFHNHVFFHLFPLNGLYAMPILI